jgi:hypothetical protein
LILPSGQFNPSGSIDGTRTHFGEVETPVGPRKLWYEYLAREMLDRHGFCDKMTVDVMLTLQDIYTEIQDDTALRGAGAYFLRGFAKEKGLDSSSLKQVLEKAHIDRDMTVGQGSWTF